MLMRDLSAVVFSSELVTVPQWSAIMMLLNLKSPETEFQAAFRVQSPWSIKNPDGDNPNEEEILKPVCFVFDFAPTRALRQLSEYGIGLSPGEANPENAVRELVSFLPVLAYDRSEEHTSELQSLLRISYAVFCLKKQRQKKHPQTQPNNNTNTN